MPDTTGKFIADFSDHLRTRGMRSIRKVPYWLKVYINWLEDRGLEISSVTPFAAEEFQIWLSTLESDNKPHYASATVADIVTVVDQFHVWLTEERQFKGNPFFGLPRVKKEHKLPRNIPSQAEMAAKLETLRTFWKAQKLRDRRNGYRVHVMAEVLYATGIRLNELATIDEADIDWDQNIIYIRHAKGGTPRAAYLNDYAARVLWFYVRHMRAVVNHWHEDGDHLFGVKNGQNLGAALNGWLKSTCGFTCHGFRHAVGTHLLQRGCDLRFIQLILGHEDLKSTALYTKISKEDMRGQLDQYHPRGRELEHKDE